MGRPTARDSRPKSGVGGSYVQHRITEVRVYRRHPPLRRMSNAESRNLAAAMTMRGYVCVAGEFVIVRSKPKPRAKQFGADCHPPDWALVGQTHRLVSQSVSQTTAAVVPTMGGGPLWARSERFVTGQKCVSDRRQSGVY